MSEEDAWEEFNKVLKELRKTLKEIEEILE